ncbi:M23 family metallopeptidase [Clostridiaceae bacterium HSG29]|nr:M23 family metallopeptidase [Clostridiaceae bacterium HSG29]
MRDRITDYIAWFIAKLIKPVYKNREAIMSKKIIIIFASIFTIIVLGVSFANSGKAQNSLAKKNIELETVDALQTEIVKPVAYDTYKNSLEIKSDYKFMNIDQIDSAMISAYAIKINDENKVYLKTEQDAQDVLYNLKKIYISDDENTEIVKIYFDENIEINEVYLNIIDLKNIRTADEALNLIVKGTDEERKHKIKSGENFWVLADDYNISVNDLVKANPEVVPERLQIGQEVSLIVPEPLINVCTVENVTYNEKIQYDVVYEDNANLYKDEYRVKLRGAYGTKEIEAELVKKDGRELGKVVLNEEIISEPTTKVVYKGTKNPPPSIGTGVFSKPLNRGTITSGYGMRFHPVYRSYRMHTGVDIATSKGTSVLAADGGKVIYAGWKTGYGYCVIIDHGANLTSMYGHLSSINVKNGEKVYKGKTIGGVGSTGTSTGNHLHFEIRKLGNDINPNKYINLYNYY